MNIKKTIISTVVALALVAVVAPGVAKGVTIEELLAQINQLQAQLLALQSGGTVIPVGGSVPANCVGVTFTRSLRVGARGTDVKCLQSILNLSPTTKVAVTGAGSPGSETSYFGRLTLAAVKIYHAEHGWVPANQVGPLTRSALNASLASGVAPPVVPGQPVVLPVGTGLTVALAATNPTTGSVVNGSALAPLARLTFTNGDNAEVVVTQLKLKRIGISADSSLTNVYLFNGVSRLTDGASVSSTIISFNDSLGLFKVPAYGSVIITVAADISGSASETVGIQLVSAADVTTTASSVNGIYPVTGNFFTISAGTLATVKFNATTTPSGTSIDPINDYVVWQNTTSIGTRAVDLKRISFRKTGSVPNSGIVNFRLYIDGVMIGTVVQNLDSDGYVTFDLTSSPKRLEAGSRVIKVMADIVEGSSLKFTFHLWNVADATFVDTQYGANVLVALASATFSKRSAGEQTVNSGTITITKMTDSPSGNITNSATNATLAKFELKAAGERVKIETLYVSVTVSTSTVSYLRNGMLFANGVQIGSTSNLHDATTGTAYTTFNLGSSLIVAPGSPVILEVKADVYDNDGTNNVITGTTLKVVVEGDDWNNALGMSSASSIDAPASDVSGNTLIVAQGGLTLSLLTSYTAHSVVAPLYGYKLAHYTLTADTTEDVNVTNITVTLDEVSTYMSNLYVVYGDQTTTTKPSISTPANSWSTNYILAKGRTIDVMVYGTVGELMTSGTQTMDLIFEGTTVGSAVNADSNTIGSNAITYTAGEFTTETVEPPLDQLVAGNQAVVAGVFNLISSYEEYTVTELKFTANSNDPAITSASVYKIEADNSKTYLDTVPFTGTHFHFTGLNIQIPASETRGIELRWNLSDNISYGGATSGVDTQAAMTYVKYLSPSGIEDTDTSTRTANETLVYKTFPTLTRNALTGTLVNTSERELYKFTVTAPTQGAVAMKQIKLTVAWSDGGGGTDDLELESLRLLAAGSDITGSVTIQEENGLTVKGTDGISEDSDTIIITWNTQANIPASGSVQYTLLGTPQGFNVADNSSGTATDNVSIDFVPDTSAQTAGYDYINSDSPAVGAIVGLYSSTSADSSAEAATLIWSDRSSVNHSVTTGDWTNSYLITDMTAQSWTN